MARNNKAAPPPKKAGRAAAPRFSPTGRVGFVIFGFSLLYVALGGRLIQLGIDAGPEVASRITAEDELAARRPDILDRQGRVLATDVAVPSVFAEPKRMIDPDDAADKIASILTDLDPDRLREMFSTSRGFEWVKREITPAQQAQIHALGIPGIGFLTEKKRIYPNGAIAAHVLGAVDVDNKGIAGIERHIDRLGLRELNPRAPAPSPLVVAMDLGVQHAMRDELIKAMAEFQTIAAAGAIMDVRTGEMVALVSLPDYDSNNPADALKPEAINRIHVGTFEMGSTFKALTVAMALDSGKVSLRSQFDARGTLNYGRFRISDYRGQNRILNVPEIFMHSSNIGTARMALEVGVEGHKAFLKKLGQLDRLRTELPESAMPILPRPWGELNTVTISYGHGLSVTPLQTLVATAALVNGGEMVPPTFLRRTQAAADTLAVPVISPNTSDAMRYLMRLNAERGSARSAEVKGYRIGGKTGTAEKVVNGRYSKNQRLTTFTAVFPIDTPQYALVVVLDEPKATPKTHGFATAGWNAAPTTGKIIRRIAPLLGLEPNFEVGGPVPTEVAGMEIR